MNQNSIPTCSNSRYERGIRRTRPHRSAQRRPNVTFKSFFQSRYIQVVPLRPAQVIVVWFSLVSVYLQGFGS